PVLCAGRGRSHHVGLLLVLIGRPSGRAPSVAARSRTDPPWTLRLRPWRRLGETSSGTVLDEPQDDGRHSELRTMEARLLWKRRAPRARHVAARRARGRARHRVAEALSEG